MSSSTFDEAFEKVLKHEGGYVNNPKDPGGETNYGITKKTAISYGYTGDMKTIPMDTVKSIYKSLYWDKMSLDDVVKIDNDLAFYLFDFGVNAGVSRAVLALQSAINSLNKDGIDIKEDGQIGKNTIISIKNIKDIDFLIKSIIILRGYHYLNIAHNSRNLRTFIKGWLNRL
jgi:lysozyme family protein